MRRTDQDAISAIIAFLLIVLLVLVCNLIALPLH